MLILHFAHYFVNSHSGVFGTTFCARPASYRPPAQDYAFFAVILIVAAILIISHYYIWIIYGIFFGPCDSNIARELPHLCPIRLLSTHGRLSLRIMKSRKRFRISIEDESRLQNIASFSFSPLKIAMLIFGAILSAIILGFLFVLLTPAKNLIPGYFRPDRRAATEQALLRVDSIAEAYRANKPTSPISAKSSTPTDTRPTPSPSAATPLHSLPTPSSRPRAKNPVSPP